MCVVVVGVGGAQNKAHRYWSAPEHQRFLEGLKLHGRKNLKAISEYVKTRTPVQVKTHAQKYFLKLARQSLEGQGQSDEAADGQGDKKGEGEGEGEGEGGEGEGEEDGEDAPDPPPNPEAGGGRSASGMRGGEGQADFSIGSGGGGGMGGGTAAWGVWGVTAEWGTGGWEGTMVRAFSAFPPVLTIAHELGLRHGASPFPVCI